MAVGMASLTGSMRHVAGKPMGDVANEVRWMEAAPEGPGVEGPVGGAKNYREGDD